MSPRRVDRTQDCGGGEARTRLRQARLYLEVALVVTTDEPGEEATVATGNAVLAGIAAADAICCEAAGQRYRGGDHRHAVDHLEQVTGDADLAADAPRSHRPQGREPLRRPRRPGPTCPKRGAQGRPARGRGREARPRLATELLAPPVTPGKSAEHSQPSAPPTLTSLNANPSYSATLTSMTIAKSTVERVTVSLPPEVRQTTQRIADDLGTSFSAVVAEALMGWVRGRLVDAWLADHQETRGAFDEEELRALARDAGVPYLPPGRGSEEPS